MNKITVVKGQYSIKNGNTSMYDSINDCVSVVNGIKNGTV